MKKEENARKVTFKEDYQPKKGMPPIYLKGKSYAIDVNLADKLEKNGARFTAERVDFKGIREKRRAENEKRKRENS